MKTLINIKVVDTTKACMISCVLFITLCILFSPLSLAVADDKAAVDQEPLDAIDEEIRWLQAETYVITPSRIPEKIKKTASSIIVVTDKQIRQMGAKDLPDVIDRAVPSFSTYRDPMSYSNRYMRGPGSTDLIMINSLPMYDAMGQSLHYMAEDTLILDNIKRIEFVRGPGSTLHGANAYNSVINIITKKAEDVDGVELTARGGSWDTQQYNLLFGKAFSDLGVTFNINYFKTHGHSALIKEDWQTWDDRNIYIPYGLPPISLAPGHTKEDEEKIDLAVNLEYNGFTFDAKYIDRETKEPLGYLNYRLTENGSIRYVKKYYLNLGYGTSITDRLDFSVKAYRLFEKLDWDMQMAMPGFAAIYPLHYPALYIFYPPRPDFTIFPQGIFLVSDFKDSRTGTEIQTTYKMNDANTIVAGATYEKQKVYDDHRGANYLPMAEGGIIQLPSVQRWPEEYVHRDNEMEFKAIFLEDVWDITEDLRLTLGARYDDYSHFGGHFTPRAGLTWEYMKGYDLKLLYGHAYVVPGYFNIIQELPGTTIGPQTIDTYEVSFGANFSPNFEGRITLFRSNENDIIIMEDFYFKNKGARQSEGFEIEARYDFGRGTYIAANYVYANMKKHTAPRVYMGKIMSNIRLSRYLNLYVDCYHKGGYSPEPWHLGEKPIDRTNVNLSLIARKFLKGYEGFELRGSIYNLFDEEWSIQVEEAIPYGYPQPGTNFLIEVKYEF